MVLLKQVLKRTLTTYKLDEEFHQLMTFNEIIKDVYFAYKMFHTTQLELKFKNI